MKKVPAAKAEFYGGLNVRAKARTNPGAKRLSQRTHYVLKIGGSAEEGVFAGHFYAEVFVGEASGYAASWGAVEEADLDEEGFVDLF
jgi:hypothetical protein